MIKSVTIGDKEVILVANGATPYRYKMVFGSDLMKELTEIADTEDVGTAMDVVSRLAFIMTKQAEHADMNALNEELFIEWLEQFETMDMIHSYKDILAVYTNNMHSSSKAKKK